MSFPPPSSPSFRRSHCRRPMRRRGIRRRVLARVRTTFRTPGLRPLRTGRETPREARLNRNECERLASADSVFIMAPNHLRDRAHPRSSCTAMGQS